MESTLLTPIGFRTSAAYVCDGVLFPGQALKQSGMRGGSLAEAAAGN